MKMIMSNGEITKMHYLNDERRLIRQVAREFTDQEVLPLANSLDPQRGEIPMGLRNQMAALGYFAIRIPVEEGGLGLGVFEYCLISEELARGWMSVASIIARSNSLMKMGLWSKAKRLEKTRLAASGDYLSAIAFSEPQAGSDLKSLSCRAILKDNQWLISGNKYWCTFADGADYIELLARVDGVDENERVFKGIRTFIIEKARGALPPGCRGAPIPKIGYFGWKTWELAFDQCAIPKENIVSDQIDGSESEQPVDGFQHAVNWLNAARVQTAARAIGLAQGAFEAATAYAKQRVQFNQPIAAFQETRFKLAKMAANIEAARQLMYHAATLMDLGERADQEASMAKWFATEMAEDATSDAMQIFGGAGYTTLYPIERYWRDARLTKIFEGTSEIQLRIISDRLLGKP